MRAGARLERDPRVVRAEALIALVLIGAMSAVFGITHGLAPRLLTHFEQAPELAGLPMRTTNRRGAAGDPVNVAVIGTRDELVGAMAAAGWTLAAAATRSTDIAIAKSVLFDRPDSTAPVSPLYLFGRPQDMAFEREVGRSARRRHHVRFWLSPVLHDRRPVWLADATFDLRAGISRRGLHPTHHIDSDVDQERDTLAADLVRTHRVLTVFEVTGMGPRVASHNAEGDRFDTDGEIRVLVLSQDGAPSPRTDTVAPPALVALKDRLWQRAHAMR